MICISPVAQWLYVLREVQARQRDRSIRPAVVEFLNVLNTVSVSELSLAKSSTFYLPATPSSGKASRTFPKNSCVPLSYRSNAIWYAIESDA